MIIFRPHRGSLEASMKEKKEFKSLQQMIQYIIDDHNETIPFFQISFTDLYISLYSPDGDDRIGWHDLFVICFESFDRINDKLGYLKYFNGEQYNHPCGVIGFFSTDYI